MRNGCIFLMMVLWSVAAVAQEVPPPDTSRVDTLAQVTVTGFEQNRSIMSSGAIVRVIQSNDADLNNKVSWVHAMNTVAGVRMEERSPGSYRLNIRGSTLR